MKTWVYWMEFFEKEAKLVHPGIEEGYVSPESKEGMKILLRHYEETEQECRSFSSSGYWSQNLPKEVRLCLAWRLHEAQSLCTLLCITQGTKPTQMVIRPPDLRRTPVGKVLRWFLISYWYRRCHVAVQNKLPESLQYGPPVEP